MISYHQMTLADIFTETQEIFESDKPEFLKLLKSTIDLSELISVSFRNHFYASTGRPREYSLTSLLWALIIQRIFSIPTDILLLTFLEYSKDLREFCGFTTLKPQFLRNKLTPRESSNSCVFFWMAETLIPWPSPVSTR